MRSRLSRQDLGLMEECQSPRPPGGWSVAGRERMQAKQTSCANAVKARKETKNNVVQDVKPMSTIYLDSAIDQSQDQMFKAAGTESTVSITKKSAGQSKAILAKAAPFPFLPTKWNSFLFPSSPSFPTICKHHQVPLAGVTLKSEIT